MQSQLNRFLLVVALVFTLPAVLAGQEGGEAGVAGDTLYHLVLTDGSSFYGTIESETSDRVVFVTTGGARLEFERSQIRVLEVAEGRIVDGEVWARDPNGTRLFFGPTGRSLRSGEGYVGLFELFFSFGAIGVGDNLVLAGGTPVLPEVIGRVLYVAPKLRVASGDGFDLAVGALSFFLTESLESGTLGVAYGVGTFGDGDNAATVGAGWGFALGDDAAVSNEPVFLVGGERRTSARVKLITENYFIVAGDGLVGLYSGGVRFIGDRFSADLGVGGGFGAGDSFCCAPVLSASYVF